MLARIDISFLDTEHLGIWSTWLSRHEMCQAEAPPGLPHINGAALVAVLDVHVA